MNYTPPPKSTREFKQITPAYTTASYNLLEDKELYELFKSKVKLAISKFKSSIKTRTVYHLLNKNLISIDLIQSTIKIVPPVVCSIDVNTKVLRGIRIDPTEIDDSTYNESLLAILSKINEINKKIREEKKLINDLQAYKIEKLEKEKKEYFEKFEQSVDWIKVVDLAYFGYLMGLAEVAVDKNSSEKIKLFMTAEMLLDKQIRKILTKTDKTLFDDPITESNYKLALQFFILTYYLQISKKEAIKILSEHKGEWVHAALEKFLPEEDLKKYESPELAGTPEAEAKKQELIEKKEKLKKHYDNLKKDLQKLKVKDFDDLAVILSTMEVVNITKSYLNHAMENMVGKEVYILYYTYYPFFMALMANLVYKTQIFPKLFSVDDELQKRMEQLLLNHQRKLIIKERKII